MKKLVLFFLIVALVAMAVVPAVSFAGGRYYGRSDAYYYSYYGNKNYSKYLDTTLAVTAIAAGTAVLNTVIQAGSQQYQQGGAADECYKYVPTGYIDQGGQFVQTGQQRMRVSCQ